MRMIYFQGRNFCRKKCSQNLKAQSWKKREQFLRISWNLISRKGINFEENYFAKISPAKISSLKVIMIVINILLIN